MMEDYHLQGTYWLDGEATEHEEFIKLPQGTVFKQAVDQEPEVGFFMTIDLPWGQ